VGGLGFAMENSEGKKPKAPRIATKALLIEGARISLVLGFSLTPVKPENTNRRL
jgi:hypothetical protein